MEETRALPMLWDPHTGIETTTGIKPGTVKTDNDGIAALRVLDYPPTPSLMFVMTLWRTFGFRVFCF